MNTNGHEITLNDLLRLTAAELNNTKIRLMMVPGDDKTNDPHKKYLENPSEVTDGWFLWRKTKNHFRAGETGIGFLNLRNDRWLLVTVKKILEVLPEVTNRIAYTAKEAVEYQKYFGRVVVNYHNTSKGNMVHKAAGFIDKLKVCEVFPAKYGGGEFPGYENVCLSFQELKTIIDRKKSDWISALENQKAVYLITDRESGKLYVGSATSDKGMLLDRWKSYIKTKHGGNVELKELLNEKGDEYIIKNFQFSLLENYNARTGDDNILKRESWWKDVLQTREHGLNRN
jgi:hypothetical protein